jgi:RHS repeat-associated protein
MADATGASQTTTSTPMNFRLAPGGLDYDSAKWTQIGTVTSIGAEAVSVTLSTGSTKSGTIPADAVLFKPTGLDVARTTYEWDHQNRLTKVTNESAAFSATGVMTLSPRDTTTYAYDVLGRRAAVTYDLVGPADGGGDFRRVSVYDGSQVVWTETGTNREQMVSQGTTQALLWAPGVDQLLAIQERLGGTGAVKQPVWALTDHLGTVKDYLAKAPTAGAESGLLLTRRYSAFGTPVAAKVWSTLPIATFTDIGGKSGFFYVGQEYDATTGLQYSRARYYDPVSSEFISQDPLGFAGGDTNLYRRAGNSPANATDPSGLSATAIGAGVGFVGGFIYGGLSGSDSWDWDRAWAAGGSAALVGAGIGSLIDTGGASAILAGAAIAAGAQSASRGNLFTPGAKVDWGGYGRGLVQGTIEGAIGGAVGAGVALGGARMVAASFGTSALGTTATAVVSGFAGGFAGDQSGQLAAMAVGVQAPAEYSVSRSVYAGAFGAGVAAGVGIVGAARQAWAARGPNSAVLRSSSKLNSVERARPELLDTIRAKGRIIKIVQEGSEEARYLDFIGAEANVGGESMTHILLRQNPGKAAVLEEFLHGTQYRLGIIERLGTGGAERHVKDFMIRHRKLLGLGDQDVDILRQLMEAGL